MGAQIVQGMLPFELAPKVYLKKKYLARKVVEGFLCVSWCTLCTLHIQNICTVPCMHKCATSTAYSDKIEKRMIRCNEPSPLLFPYVILLLHGEGPCSNTFVPSGLIKKKKTANSPAHTCASAYMQQPGWKCKEGQGCRLMGEWQQWITVVADRLTTHSVHNFETSSNGKFQENPMIWVGARCGIMALRLCMPWLVV